LHGSIPVHADPTWWFRQFLIAGSTNVGRILPLTWSLDVEMQFYLLAPAIIYVLARVSPAVRWVVIAGLLLMLCVFFLNGVAADSARFFLFSGLFLAGVALALGGWVASWRVVAGGFALLFGAIFLLILCSSTRSGIWFEGSVISQPQAWVSSWWVLGAILMLPFVSRNVRIRSSRFDRSLGNLAYPLYLFHWIPREWYYHFCAPNSSSLVRGLLMTVNFAFAFGGAVLILVFIDQPMDRLRAKWVASRAVKSGTEKMVSAAQVTEKQFS
jgi:peptidoglycan/LPS O-acetylase OafA/YrhL